MFWYLDPHCTLDPRYTTFFVPTKSYCTWNKLFSGDLKSGLVWISNGWKEVGLQMIWISNGNEIQKPNHLKLGQMAAILSKPFEILRETFRFRMAWFSNGPIMWKPDHLKSNFQKFRILNGGISDPRCTPKQPKRMNVEGFVEQRIIMSGYIIFTHVPLTHW